MQRRGASAIALCWGRPLAASVLPLRPGLLLGVCTGKTLKMMDLGLDILHLGWGFLNPLLNRLCGGGWKSPQGISLLYGRENWNRADQNAQTSYIPLPPWCGFLKHWSRADAFVKESCAMLSMLNLHSYKTRRINYRLIDGKKTLHRHIPHFLDKRNNILWQSSLITTNPVQKEQKAAEIQLMQVTRCTQDIIKHHWTKKYWRK